LTQSGIPTASNFLVGKFFSVSLTMADPKSRARVERLLRGDIRVDDLTNLFLFARDRSDGRESVQEIGDFVAHHDERTKGIITRNTRDWFAIVRFFGPVFRPGGPHKYNLDQLPAITPQFIQATLRRLDHETIKKETGLSRAQANKMLPAILDGLLRNPDGTYAVSPTYREKEISLLKTLTSRIIAKPAFTGERLVTDFWATLRGNSLLSKEEQRSATLTNPAIQLFAVSIMHNCMIQIGEGSMVRLEAASIDGNIEVACSIISDTEDPKQIGFASALFVTSLDPLTYCQPQLLSVPRWQMEIELKPDGRLGILA
jgi:hypothetical protein